MAADLPTDVRTVLAQLFTEGREAARNGDLDTASAATATAATVATNKLPDGAFRDRLLHGCARVEALLDPDGECEPDVAAEYLAAMARRVEKQGT